MEVSDVLEVLDVPDVLEVPEAMRCVLLRMLVGSVCWRCCR